MKRCKIFSFIAASVLLLASCEQEPQPTYPNRELPIFNGYMQFSTEVSTRADLATNMRGRNFGVLGYSYSYTTDWDAAKKLAVPDTFYDQEVTCGSNGICSYDISADDGKQLKLWNATKWYTFFAYSPYQGAGISLSDATKEGTPYLTYEYAWKAQAEAGGDINVFDNNEMFDLMTAEHIDADGSTSVGLNFKHRLFAIEVLANNYNESAFVMEQKIDENGNPVMVVKRDSDGKPILETNTDGTPVNDQTKSIQGLTLTVQGLTHTSMTIPLSMRSEEMENIKYYPVGNDATYPLKDKNVMFNVQNQGATIPAFNDPQPDGRGGGVATSISKMGNKNSDGYLMFIPQDGHVLVFSVKWTDALNNEYEKTITSNITKFDAGKLYQIIINFVGDGITIALIEAGAWDYRTVTHRFE